MYCGYYYPFTGDAPWRSRDAGETWERTIQSWTRYMPSPWEEGLIFATWGVDSYALARSTDDGESWNWISGTEVPGLCDRVVYHSEDSLVVFACLVSPWGLHRSTDRGETWELALEGEVSAFANDPADPRHWIALVMSSPQSQWPQYAESFDDGTSWEVWDFTYDVWTGRQMVFDLFDSRTIYLAYAGGSPEPFGILRSTDGGVTWDQINNGLTELIGPCELYLSRDRPGEMLAARRDGLWRWTDQQLAEDSYGTVPNALQIESVSPCPFHGTVRAWVSLQKGGMVEATVHSLQGASVRRAFHMELESGTHSFMWDGSDDRGHQVAPGAYVLKVRAGEAEASHPMVKLR